MSRSDRTDSGCAISTTVGRASATGSHPLRGDVAMPSTRSAPSQPGRSSYPKSTASSSTSNPGTKAHGARPSTQASSGRGSFDPGNESVRNVETCSCTAGSATARLLEPASRRVFTTLLVRCIHGRRSQPPAAEGAPDRACPRSPGRADGWGRRWARTARRLPRERENPRTTGGFSSVIPAGFEPALPP